MNPPVVETPTPQTDAEIRAMAKAWEEFVSLQTGDVKKLCNAAVENIELRAKLTAAEKAVAWANNSLFGSHGYFLSKHGGPDDEHHLDTPIEALKKYGNEQWQRAEAAESSLRDAQIKIAELSK